MTRVRDGSSSIREEAPLFPHSRFNRGDMHVQTPLAMIYISYVLHNLFSARSLARYIHSNA